MPQESIDRTLQRTDSKITWRHRWDHWLARWGVNRGGHRVAPGLYALGAPTPDSPVFVTANYTLSFDALRSALDGITGYILVLDTQGINVWCAAGKGTFGTDELVRRIEATGLGNIVRHRELIVPQLGAPGIAAHEVRKQSKFKVDYGPVRASDLPAYLQTRQATPEMREVRFPLRDRLVLIPVELVYVLLPMFVAALVAFLLGGWLASAAVIAASVAGTVLFPILLPWIPTHGFSTKGLVLGGLLALFFASLALFMNPAGAMWVRAIGALAYLFALPPITAYLALNFTGSTTFTSRTGVRREMFAYIPLMASLFAAGVVLALARASFQLVGGS